MAINSERKSIKPPGDRPDFRLTASNLHDAGR
jgi:hypothetical protein